MSFEEPFAFRSILGLNFISRADGACQMTVDVDPARHFNPQGVAHGAVAYALADTAMGGAISSVLPVDMWCATLEIKFNYHKAVVAGLLTCDAVVLHQGKRVANVDARLYQHGQLVSSANGNFAIFPAPTAKG